MAVEVAAVAVAARVECKALDKVVVAAVVDSGAMVAAEVGRDAVALAGLSVKAPAIPDRCPISPNQKSAPTAKSR